MSATTTIVNNYITNPVVEKVLVQQAATDSSALAGIQNQIDELQT